MSYKILVFKALCGYSLNHNSVNMAVIRKNTRANASSKSAPNLSARTPRRNNFTRTIKIPHSYFLKDGLLVMNSFLSLLEAIDMYKRLTEVIKINGRSHDKCHDFDNRSAEAAESSKTIAEDCGVPEST
jgi:hypothetical protein